MGRARQERGNRNGLAAHFTAAQKGSLRRRVLGWYGRHARDLPWRRSRDPYRVWVSEVMLQQTQVATVREYFERFVASFPTVEALAMADETAVLRLWEGLGYYRRARQLRAAAKQLVEERGGEIPDEPEELRKLPGIGRYTAGAIASIAFGRRAAILEANTIRLLSRLVAYRGNPHTVAGQRMLWAVAEEILPRREVAAFNQALMELGSLVCTPVEPRCEECPLGELCLAKERELQDRIPRPKPQPKTIAVREAAVVIRKRGKVLVRCCAEGERWAGLWDFPRFELDAAEPGAVARELVARVREQTGITCKPGGLLQTIKHGVTRYRIALSCYEAEFVGGRASGGPSIVRWLARGDLSTLPFSTTGRRLATLIASMEKPMKHGRGGEVRERK
ncbi:MAG: A/G-specific adenine glycosylase [Pirellulales bacterium]|nr:A/G-specific adenine glycosylase [Pirellulales bacterium]